MICCVDPDLELFVYRTSHDVARVRVGLGNSIGAMDSVAAVSNEDSASSFSLLEDMDDSVHTAAASLNVT